MSKKENLLKHMVDLLELPDSSYEKAIKRYEDLGAWFDREESSCFSNDVHIFSQGSFRLGTAIRPLNEKEEYDLDLACNLRKGITSATHSQSDLKEIVRVELEAYRKARGISAELESKHRCWCLEYADDLSFHMDIVPCIPETLTSQKALFDSLQESGLNQQLATNISERAVGITDDQNDENFKSINANWQISNPAGYAKWFESRKDTNRPQIALEHAQVEKVPLYKQKTPLQRIIQLLKRHRDQMYIDNQDSKPISVIISTIVASTYQGDDSLESTLKTALKGLSDFVNSNSAFLPNPVNPEENFADKWTMEKYNHLRLKDNFSAWVQSAIRDFEFIESSDRSQLISEAINQKLSITITKETVDKIIGTSPTASLLSKPKDIVKTSSRPWLNEK